MHRRSDNLLAARVALSVTVIVMLLAPSSRAQSQFRELVWRLPSSTNAVVIMNLDKMKKSPMGVREGFAENLGKAFEAGLARIPPHATRLVAGAEIDLEFMEPVSEVAVFDLDTPPSLETVAREYGGTMDTLDGLAAIRLNTDAFVIQLGPQTVGVMRPANRQAVLRWIRETRPGTGLQLSPYIQQAAGYSDEAGTDIIIAIDLAGAFSWERVGKYLHSKESLLKEAGVDLKQATSMLQNARGLRVGIRIGEQPSGKLVLDFGKKVSAPLPADFAKTLVLEILADSGTMIADFSAWTCEVQGTEISLAGSLSRDGLRRVASLVDSPAPAHAAGGPVEPFVSPGDAKANVASTSLHYFKQITDMFDDLKRDWRELKTLASGAVYFDRYSRRIDQMPTLNVDEDLLDYGQWVSKQFRAAAGAVRTMGIRGGARKAQITGYDVGPTASRSWGGTGYSPWGGYRAGYAQVNYYNPHDTIKRVGAERRKIKSQETATMATNVFAIRDNVTSATNDVRRAMTQKYQVQF